jgi:hypothetical protein
VLHSLTCKRPLFTPSVDVGDDFVEHVQYVVENIPDADVPAPRDFFEWN